MDNVLYRKAFEKDDPAEETRPDIVCTGECNGYAVFYSDDELGTCLVAHGLYGRDKAIETAVKMDKAEARRLAQSKTFIKW